MANEDITIIDAEFQTTGDEKIDFKSILFKQIDYIRFLRTQDMGEFTLIDIDAIQNKALKDEIINTWLRNSSIFQNAVKSLQNMLITYEDETYLTNLKAIEKMYNEKLAKGQERIINKYKNYKNMNNRIIIDKNNELSLIKKMFAIIHIPKKYDLLFRECLLLMGRAKFIGGFDNVSQNG